MTSDLKRWACKQYWAFMEEVPNGDYVRYEDYAALVQEKDAFTEENVGLKATLDGMTSAMEDLRQEKERLESQLAVLRRPVSEKEYETYFRQVQGSVRDMATVSDVNALLAAREASDDK